MADTKISNLTIVDALADADVLPLADISGGPDSNGALISQLRNFLTPRGYIFGLKLANNGTDATNDIDIAAGEAQAESHDEVMTLTGTIVKQIDAAWAVGTNAGGMNTGSVANATWYEVHLIKRLDTGVVDVMFTTTANRATLPTNYTKQRRIGWVRRGTATNLAFTQVEDHFTLTTQINDVAASVASTAAQVTLTAPPNSIVRFRSTLVAGTTGTNLQDQTIVFSEIVEGNVTPANTTGIASLSTGEPASAIASGVAGHFELRLSSSSQIEHDGSANAVSAAAVFDISTFGWIDYRRRLDAL